MALPLKSGADLYNQQALRLRLHNLGADPLSDYGVGQIYFNTSTESDTSKHVRLYDGTAFRSLAYLDEIANNEEFITLKEKVELLSGDVDTDSIISNMKEVAAFLDGFAEDADLMDYLTTELGKKLDKTGGTIESTSAYGLIINTKTDESGILFRSNGTTKGILISGGTWGGAAIVNANNYNGIGVLDDGTPYFKDSARHTLIHSGNYADQIGDYYLKTSGGTITNSSSDALTINRTGGNPYVTFSSDGTLLGQLGYNATTKDLMASIKGYFEALIHSGNVRDYALKLDGSNARATTLTSSQNLDDYQYGFYSYTNGNNPTNSFGDNTALFAFASNRGNDKWQIAFDGNGVTNTAGPRFGIRGNYSGQGWTSWYRIATTASNVASATKLQDDTAFTAWGQTFFENGKPKNVSGDITLEDASILGASNRKALQTSSTDLYIGGGFTGDGDRTFIYGNVIRIYTGASQQAMFINASGGVTIGSSDLAGTGKYFNVQNVFSVNKRSSDAPASVAQLCVTEIGGSKNGIHMYVDSNSASTKRPFILQYGDNYGNVLIGTTTDNGGKLQIEANVANLISLKRTNAHAGAYIDYIASNAANRQWRVGASDSGSFVFENNNSGTAVNAMTINSLGNVLIGTTTDDGVNKLQVNGGIGLNGAEAARVYSTGLYIGYGTTRREGLPTSLWGKGISFVNSVGQVIMKILDDGNVGIGTDSPTEKLSVDGNITATGEISCGGAGEEGVGGGGASVFQHVFTPSASPSVTVLHNLGTEDIVITLYEKDATSGLWSVCLTDIEIVSANEVTVTFGSTSNQEHKVVIMGGVI